MSDRNVFLLVYCVLSVCAIVVNWLVSKEGGSLWVSGWSLLRVMDLKGRRLGCYRTWEYANLIRVLKRAWKSRAEVHAPKHSALQPPRHNHQPTKQPQPGVSASQRHNLGNGVSLIPFRIHYTRTVPMHIYLFVKRLNINISSKKDSKGRIKEKNWTCKCL